MVRFNSCTFKISIIAVILLLTAWFIREFSFYDVDINEDGARVEINFIFPMEKESINNTISIVSDIENSNFDCKLEWKSNRKLLIYITEKNQIKGQKVHFLIKNAKTTLPYVRKSINIPVQFQVKPKIIGLTKFVNIPTSQSIIIKFNTTMKRANINKYIVSDGKFDIMPVEGSSYSQWRLTPKMPLDNDRRYTIYLRKGMPATSGLLLGDDQIVTIDTASKPEITSIYPEDKSRWIGIYPKIIVESKKPMKKAVIKLDDETIEGTIHNERWAEFSLLEVLDFETTYDLEVQITSEYGERSDIYRSKFSTIPLEEDKLWVEVVLKDKHKVLIHRGRDIIREMPCSGGTNKTPTLLGTYYLKDRGTRFFARKISEGANYWVRIHGNYLFHGLPRDENWVISREAREKLGYPASHGCVRLNEIDAKWFYDNVPENTMVIIHE